MAMTVASAGGEHAEVIRLRAWGVPDQFGVGPVAEAEQMMMAQFRERYPWIDPISTTGLTIPGGSRTMDMVPFMQIAGDLAPDVLYVNFRQSQTYIGKKLLYPLDRYIEDLAGASIHDSSRLTEEQYVAALKRGSSWDLIEQRVPPQCWQVMRRRCPHERNCAFRAQAALPPLEDHDHVWAFPMERLVVGLQFDRSLFTEYAHAGVQPRPPRDWDELLAWAKAMTHPQRRHFGLKVSLDLPGWNFLNFLYSAGGHVVKQDGQGRWYCTLDSEEAVEAAYFYARLHLEPIEREGRLYRGVIATGSSTLSNENVRIGMTFTYLDSRVLSSSQDQNKGFGPVPAGPHGHRGSEFNARMCGIFSGLADDERRRDAAWHYIAFYDGPEARRIRTEKMVEAGLGKSVAPALLRQFNDDGRYDTILRQVPPELEAAYQEAFASGVPEPYGENCQYVYDEISKPLGEIFRNATVIDAIDRNQPDLGKAEIRRILAESTVRINQKMLGNLPPAQRQKRERVAWAAIAGVVVVFAVVLRKVVRTFRPPQINDSDVAPTWQFGRYRIAYLMMAPGIASIAIWAYWPLIQGSLIAFQDYSVLGDSRWVGASNFASVLFDGEFWQSLRVSLDYTVLFMLFGFGAPILLALLLQEVPRGSILFRTIFYLPAVLSGVVVIFLWKSFYSSEGLVNQVLNGLILIVNWLPGVDLAPIAENWLENRRFALLFCLLPTVWAGMGPGCLIYLAALKTIPEELYEAADIDGAGTWHKVFRVALPSIRPLIMINFIGAMIGSIRGAGGFVLAMTGGGPYTQQGGATEVVGLKLFYTTFGRLDFGVGAAMAWVLGAMLIGFTVMQLQRISRLEFRTTEKVS